MTKEKELRDKIKCIRDETKAIKDELKILIEELEEDTFGYSNSRSYEEGYHESYITRRLEYKEEGKEDLLTVIRESRKICRRWCSSSRREEPLDW